MQFVRIGPPGQEFPAVRTDDGDLLDLRSITTDIDGRRTSTRRRLEASSPPR